MTYALIGVVAGLTAVAGVLAGAAWWFGKRGFDAMDRVVAEANRVVELKEVLGEQKLTQERTHETLKKVQAERDRQVKARQVTLRQLEDLQKAIDNGELSSADGIRATLGRLRALAKEVRDLPGNPTADDG